MAIEPEEFLVVSKTLIESETEVYARSAAGRAYYAAYLFSIPFSETLQKVPVERPGSHEVVIRKYSEYFSKSGDHKKQLKIRSVGINLIHLRKIRSAADYKLQIEFDHNKGKEAIRYAEKIIADLKEL